MWRLFITDQKIGVRLFVSIAIPMVILLVFASMSLYGFYSSSVQMAKVDRLASFSPAITNLVHELQKERGASAGFIGSNGSDQFTKKLTAQRKATDLLWQKFNKSNQAFDKKAYGSKFSSLLSDANKNLAGLTAVRSKIGGLAISVEEMAKHYTKTISELLQTVSYVGLLSPDAHLSNQISAYTSFLEAKERAGLERAMGAVGFGTGKFAPKIHKKFAALIAQQKLFIDQFSKAATTKQVARYKKKIATDIVSKVETMRAIGLNSAYSSSSKKPTISGGAWFDAITQKINLMKEIEDSLSSDITNYTNGSAQSLKRSFYTTLAITLTILVSTIALVVKVSSSIIDPIGKITTYMAKLTKGDSSAQLELDERQDQIGDMMKSIEVFRQQNLQKEEMETQNKKLAVKFESDKAVSSIKQLAQSMEELNGVAMNLGLLDTHSQQVSGSSQTIASAAEQLVSSVGDISVNSEGASNDAMETERTVSNGQEAAQKAMGSIQVIWDTMEDSVNSLQDLTSASVQIEQILNVIEDIAEQTNLLALNATIEAARAGEAGKGFAVVATEVKNLANQSSKATEDIAQRIQALKAGMENISKTMDRSRDAVATGRGSIEETAQTMDLAAQQVSSVTAKMTDITEILHQQKGSSSEIARSINEVAEYAMESQKQVELVVERITSTNNMMTNNAQDWFQTNSSRSLCEIAKVDHILFQKEIIDTVMGRSTKNSQNLADHHNCRLGKWYDTMKVPEIANTPIFKELAGPHKMVHTASKEAIEAHNAGQKEVAYAAIEKMNEAGSKVLDILNQLSDLLEQQENSSMSGAQKAS